MQYFYKLAGDALLLGHTEPPQSWRRADRTQVP